MAGEKAEAESWYEKRLKYFQATAIQSPRGTRYPCPCCGYLTLTERRAWEICELCDWEDDGQDEPEADEVWGGPNGALSLSEARRNFKEYLHKYPPTERTDLQSDSPVEISAKKAIMVAFDAMRQESNADKKVALWQQIYDYEDVLERELFRRVREYEGNSSTRGKPR